MGAVDVIAGHLRNGDLPATAKQIWKSDERWIINAWKTIPDDVEGGTIPTGYWRFDKDSATDRSEWRLVVSRLSVTSRHKPRRRIMMRGVRFSLNALKRLEPKVFGPLVKESRGRPKSTGERDTGWLVVVELALAGRLNRHEYPNQGDLIAHLQELLAERLPASKGKSILGEGQIYDIARQVLPLMPPQPAGPEAAEWSASE